jgi:hypothetical protein
VSLLLLYKDIHIVRYNSDTALIGRDAWSVKWIDHDNGSHPLHDRTGRLMYTFGTADCERITQLHILGCDTSAVTHHRYDNYYLTSHLLPAASRVSAININRVISHYINIQRSKVLLVGTVSLVNIGSSYGMHEDERHIPI